jgi:hypothetical protein
MINTIIDIIHLLLFITIVISPLVNNHKLKKMILLLLLFILFHFLTKYGKCGIINIERIFLKNEFKNGFFYKLIRPIISYKKNYIYQNLFLFHLIYIFILFYQLRETHQIELKLPMMWLRR